MMCVTERPDIPTLADDLLDAANAHEVSVVAWRGECNRLVRLLRRAADAQKSEWQSIETAPKDGSWVLLSGGRTIERKAGALSMADRKRPVVCQFERHCSDSDTVEGLWRFAWCDSGHYGQYIMPTAWMPLP